MAADHLRDALEALVREGDVPVAVRAEIGASWHRSLRSGLRPDHFEAMFDADVDGDALLLRAARPVLAELAEDLSGSTAGVVLTDGRAQVIERWVADRQLHIRLDDILLAPGFMYAKGLIGTNAIGTALAQREPSIVNGEEHLADLLTPMACAAVPTTDPGSGRILGAVDLTCWAQDTSPLLMSLARRAGREIQQRVFDDERVAERVLLQRFLRERRGAKGPLVFASGQRMITNAAADRLVGAGDGPILWEHARRLLHKNVETTVLALSHGISVTVRCEPVMDGGSLVGALLRFEPIVGQGAESSRRGRSSSAFGWTGITETEQSVTNLVAEGIDQQADRRAPVRLPLHRRLAPALDLPQARCSLAGRTHPRRPRPAGSTFRPGGRRLPGRGGLNP